MSGEHITSIDGRSPFDIIVENRSKSCKPELFTDILLQLMWMTDNSSLSVADDLERWASDCSDKFKVEIALRNEEVFLKNNRDALKKVLIAISLKWPDLKSLCDARLGAWDRQHGVT